MAVDEREFRDMKRWYHQNRHSAQFGRETHRHSPKSGGPDVDWVTIQVRNITTGLMRAWSPVHVEGLVNFEDPDLADINNVPPGMLHPDRTFDATWGYKVSTGPLSFQFAWRNDSLLHAVIIQDLQPNQIGTAVIKGVVPGRIKVNSQTSVARQPVYLYMVPEQPLDATNGWPPSAAFPRGWTSEPGFAVIPGTPNVSVCREVWRSNTNTWWGLFDLNHSRPGRIFTAKRDVSGNPWSISITNNGGLTPNYGGSGLPSYQTWIDFAYHSGYPANSIWESRLVTTQGSVAPPWGIVFKRHCQYSINGSFLWTPGPMAGQLHSSEPYMYQIKGQKIELYLETWNAVTPSLILSTLVATYEVGGFLSAIPSAPSAAGTKYCGYHFTGTIAPTGTAYERPTMLRLKVKWMADDGTTTGLVGNTTFSNPWSDISIENFTAYVIQKDGVITHPPEEDGSSPGGVGPPIGNP